MTGQGAQAWTNFDQVMGSTLPQLISWFQTAGAMGVLSGQKMKQGMLDALSGDRSATRRETRPPRRPCWRWRGRSLARTLTWAQLNAKIKETHASMNGANQIVQATTVKMGNLMQVAQNLGNVMSSDIASTMDKAKLSASGLTEASGNLADALMKPGVSADTLVPKIQSVYRVMLSLTGTKSAADNFLHAWLDSFGKTGQAAWRLWQSMQQVAPKIPQALTDAINKGAPGAAAAASHIMHGVQSGVTDQNLPGKLGKTGTDSSTAFLHGLNSKTQEITKWASTVNTSVKGELQHLPPAATAVGKAAGQGMVQGLDSQQAAVDAAAAHLASTAAAAMRAATQTHSPSKVTMAIGMDVAAGFAGGIVLGEPRVVQAVSELSASVLAELQGIGPISTWQGGGGGGLPGAAERIGKSTVAALIKGLTGSTSQIQSAITSLLKTVRADFAAGKLYPGLSGWQKDQAGMNLIYSIKADNIKLHQLAAERQKIANEIKAANAYAASVTSNLISSTGLAGVTQPTDPKSGKTLPWTVGNIQSQMDTQLKQLKAFDHNIDVLRHMGLNKTLLNQIIQAGYQQGGALAQALAHGSESQILGLNSTESQIIKASKKIGKDSAEYMYDSGKNAGKGFLSGLKSEEKAITKEMEKIANIIVQAIRKALKIKSPSEVMHEQGYWAAMGLAKGLEDGSPMVVAAAEQIAAAVARIKLRLAESHPYAPLISTGTASGLAPHATPMVVVHQHIAGSVLTEQQLQQHVQTAVLKYQRRNPNNGLTLGGRASGAPVTR